MRSLFGRTRRPADLSIYHAFQRPPYGGGNQFLIALRAELRARGIVIESGTLSPTTRACLFNSFNFDFDRLRSSVRPGCRMVHRVDGPIGSYRGSDDGTDRRIEAINRELAHATVLQSRYSLEAHRALGIELREPRVITNAVDPRIFHPPSVRRPPAAKLRLISTSWSDNPMKGAATYAWLDEHLDQRRYEYTFVGRVRATFRNIRVVPPVASEELADRLRAHDVYVAASLNDPCSNALLEALACGLPAIYARSGGHSELVGEGGLGFEAAEEIPALLERLREEYDRRVAGIRSTDLAAIADDYLATLGIGTGAR